MLSVQVLGADGREGNTPGATAAVFEPLCGMVHRHGIVHLELLLVGPHVDPSLDATRHSGLCGGTEQAELTVIYSTSMYHKLEDRVRRGSAATFCFNAGVWGYESWIPTIAAACDADCAVVITSYNSHEAADDKDALEDAEEEGLLQPAVAGLRWVWEPEKNPFRSRCQRESSTVPGRMLADNHHWQCVASSK